MQIHSVGIDLGKTTFHLVALSAAGKVLLRKKFTQKQTDHVHSQHAMLSDWHGGLCGSSLPQPYLARARP
jgi:predicted NBD/HSP70 family sugar kinase